MTILARFEKVNFRERKNAFLNLIHFLSTFKTQILISGDIFCFESTCDQVAVLGDQQQQVKVTLAHL